MEPLRPSNRISTLAAPERTTVAQSRSVEPGKLSRLVRGDLDWIVLKAMDKDRNRRYETANEFAKDIQRYLDNEPVAARKPSLGYVFHKFARRHQMVLATAACFVLLLIGECRRRCRPSHQEQVPLHRRGRGPAQGDGRDSNGKPNSGASPRSRTRLNATQPASSMPPT